MQTALLAVIMALSVIAVALMVFPPTNVFAQEHQDAKDSSDSDSQPLPKNVEVARRFYVDDSWYWLRD